MAILEYIWIGGNNEIRSKVRVIKKCGSSLCLDNLPEWNYDGSSTNQATGIDSEVIIKPKAIYKDPFSADKLLVLCDTYLPSGEPHKTNTRVIAEEIFKQCNAETEKPLFGIEHEFFVINNKTNKPLGFPENGYPNPQGPYYCSVGGNNAFGREFLYSALNLCLKAGIDCTGCNLEVCPGQMEIQICSQGIKAADDSIIFKYIVNRLSEKYDYRIDFAAKPIKGDWNGSGCHVNFSTESMRSEGGYEVIMESIKKLEKNHHEHIELYGDDNRERLTGDHETSNISVFSYGLGNRGCSIRIPTSTSLEKKGYFEDRRPSSSADMYVVTSKLFKTCME